MIRTPHIFGIITLALSFGFIFMLFFWSTYDYDPLQFETEPIPTYQQEVIAGQPIVIHFEYCKTVGAPEDLEVKLVGRDIAVELPRQAGNTPKGCRESNVVILIPNETKAGVYYIQYKNIYKVNPIRRVEESFRTVDFTVIGEPGTIPEEEQILLEPIEVPLQGQ